MGKVREALACSAGSCGRRGVGVQVAASGVLPSDIAVALHASAQCAMNVHLPSVPVRRSSVEECSGGSRSRVGVHGAERLNADYPEACALCGNARSLELAHSVRAAVRASPPRTSSGSSCVVELPRVRKGTRARHMILCALVFHWTVHRVKIALKS